MRRHPTAWSGPEDPCERVGCAMAHRRGLLGRRMLRAALVVVLLATALSGTLLVTVQVTRLRASVAELEDRRQCLLAREASLEADWAEATAPATVRARARRELGLVVPAQPDYVLMQPQPDRDGGLWEQLLAHLGGTAATDDPAAPRGVLAGAMISLQPRAAFAAEGVR